MTLDPITITILAVLALLGGVGWKVLALSRMRQEPQSTPNPDPKKTAEAHETAIVLDGADAIDAAAADHDADPQTVSDLVELADKER